MTNKTTMVLSQTLGLQVPPETKPSPTVPKPVEQIDPMQAAKEDFDVARKNINELVTKGAEALGSLISLAQAGEHPRAYEAVATLIKALSDANKDLMHIHSQRKDLTPSDQSSPTSGINAVYIGSTSDLQEIIRKSIKPKVIDVQAEEVKNGS
jgi:hypothetical protein